MDHYYNSAVNFGGTFLVADLTTIIACITKPVAIIVEQRQPLSPTMSPVCHKTRHRCTVNAIRILESSHVQEKLVIFIIGLAILPQ